MAFDKSFEGYMGAVPDNETAKARATTAWSNALEKACENIVPASTNVSAAKAAMVTVLNGSYSDNSGTTFLSAFTAFASTLATGMLPSFVAVPPPLPPILSSSATNILDAIDEFANAIVNWLQTGTATPALGGPPVNWS